MESLEKTMKEEDSTKKLLRVRPVTRAHARDLRRNQTRIERRLWRHLRGGQLDGMRWRRQHPIGRFIVDFYCSEHRLIVEVDDSSHDYRGERDEDRAAWLEAQGYRILRVTNADVRQNLDGVLAHIKAFADGVT